MKKETTARGTKLTLGKTTVKDLAVRTGVTGGAPPPPHTWRCANPGPSSICFTLALDCYLG